MMLPLKKRQLIMQAKMNKRNPRCKLTIDQERQVLWMYHQEHCKPQSIAQYFGVHPATIHNILKVWTKKEG